MPNCQSCLWLLKDCSIYLQMHIFKFLWIKSSICWCTNALTNEYIMHKCPKHPKYSPIKLLGSLLTITYRCLPNSQIGKTFRKNLKRNNIKMKIQWDIHLLACWQFISFRNECCLFYYSFSSINPSIDPPWVKHLMIEDKEKEMNSCHQLLYLESLLPDKLHI